MHCVEHTLVSLKACSWLVPYFMVIRGHGPGPDPFWATLSYIPMLGPALPPWTQELAVGALS